MARWTVDQPTTRTLDGIVALRVRTVGGYVNVLPTDDPVTFDVSDITGTPLLATHEAGILTITYEDLTREGFLDRLRPPQLSGYRDMTNRAATVNLRVPRECPVEITTVSAPIVASGLTGTTTLRSASGDITLDALGGETDLNTLSGDVEVRDVSGSMRFTSVSGRLAVAGGGVAGLTAKSGSGQLLVDTDVAPAGRIRLSSVSGEIALRVPADTSAGAELRTATGALSSEFALHRRDRRGRSSLHGNLGSGIDPATITATTVSAAISLLRREPDTPAAIPRGGQPQ